MTVRVYHAEKPFCRNPQVALSNFESGDYKLVAHVEGDDLDRAYESTNTIDRPWWENENVMFPVPGRSTSVGDIMACLGRVYMVAPAGFTRLI